MGLGPGHLVSKHVRLVRMLGRGGMGSVWVADHLALKTHVAVKFMSAAFASDPAMVTRFTREATSAAQIKSPHVVQIHDHGITGDNVPYIVMELLEGEDLSTRLKREGPLPLEDAATIVLQTCKALSKAHKLGIVHRDIKPSNIFLLDTDGDIFVKVLDFGIAKPASGDTSEVTSTGAIVGTMVYMSPEQLLSAKHVDHRADLWSVAVVAYRALTGQLPFTDEDGIGSLCLAFEQGSFSPPSTFAADLPPEVDDWFRRAFKRQPDARFPDAREMAAEFLHALGRISSPSLSTPTGPRSSGGGRAPRQLISPEARRHSASKTTIGNPGEATDPPVSGRSADGLESAATVSENVPPSRITSTATPASGAEAAKEPGTLGTASAQTITGTASTPPPITARPPRRGVAIAGLTLGVVLALGLAAAGVLKRLGGGEAKAPPAPIATEQGGNPAVQPGKAGAEPPIAPEASAAKPEVAPDPIGSPAAVTDAGTGADADAGTDAGTGTGTRAGAGTGTAAVPGAPAAPGPASPQAPGGAKTPVRPGGSPQPTPREKDYGF